jgi:hypothetical protein
MPKKVNPKGKKVTRRDFLKGFGGGALGTVVGPKLLAQDIGFITTKEGKVPLYSKKQISLTVNGKAISLV